MFWRMKNSEFQRVRGAGTKTLFKEMTERNEIPGLLTYKDGMPVGWCSIGPREKYLTSERSQRLKRIDDQPIWSIVCFNIHKSHRRQGMMSSLIRGALEHAQNNGASLVEAYPTDLHSPLLTGKKLTGYSGFMGIVDAFKENGFEEVGRASETQVIMRCSV